MSIEKGGRPPERLMAKELRFRRFEYSPFAGHVEEFQGEDVRRARELLRRELFGEKHPHPLDFVRLLKIRPNGELVTTEMLKGRFEQGLQSVSVRRGAGESDEDFAQAVEEKRREYRDSFEKLVKVLEKVDAQNIQEYCKETGAYEDLAAGRVGLALSGASFENPEHAVTALEGINATLFENFIPGRIEDFSKGIRGKLIASIPKGGDRPGYAVTLMKTKDGRYYAAIGRTEAASRRE